MQNNVLKNLMLVSVGLSAFCMAEEINPIRIIRLKMGQGKFTRDPRHIYNVKRR